MSPVGSECMMDGERPAVRPRLVQSVVLKEGSVFLLSSSTGVLGQHAARQGPIRPGLAAR
jgi:hypothetical protein